MEVWHVLITLGIIAFIIEIFTSGFISGSIGFGLIFAAIGNYLGLEAEWQILLFSCGVALAYFLVRPIILKYGFRDAKIKTNYEALINNIGIVTEEINALKHTGRVKIDGDIWRASSEKTGVIEVGTTVKVVSIKSIIVSVEPIK